MAGRTVARKRVQGAPRQSGFSVGSWFSVKGSGFRGQEVFRQSLSPFKHEVVVHLSRCGRRIIFLSAGNDCQHASVTAAADSKSYFFWTRHLHARLHVFGFRVSKFTGLSFKIIKLSSPETQNLWVGLPQVLLLVLVWLVLVPLMTCWAWRLRFSTSVSHGLSTVAQRMSPMLLIDCLQVNQ